MKPPTAVLITLLLAVPTTWFAARQAASAKTPTAPATPSARKVLYYQSAMHPWIRSDKPGRCTICGMELTPVFEGDPGLDPAGGGVVALSAETLQVMNVQTVAAAVQPLARTLTVAGTIDDNDATHRVLSAFVAGRIERLHVGFVGAEVKEGQPLAEIHSPTLLQAERDYRSLTGELREAAALRLRQMGLRPAQLEALATKPLDALTTEILAPVTGTVVARSVYGGQYVEAGAPLFEIADFSVMWFLFQAYEPDLPWLREGLTVDVTTPSQPGQRFTGRVAFIDPNLDPATRSTKVRVELVNAPPGDPRRLRHKLLGMGTVHLEAPKVLTVPRSAVLETGREAVVYVDQGGGGYARRVVQTGLRGDALVEVREGLSAGEQVVVQGNLLLDGQAELNRGHAGPAQPVGAPSTNAPARPAAAPPLSEPQREVVQQWLTWADRIGAALAADDLVTYRGWVVQARARLGEDPADRLKGHPWHPALAALVAAVPKEGAVDLKAARRDFLPMSTAAVALAQSVRRADPVWGSLKVFRCPMTRDAFPGAPTRAEWIQFQAPIRNPWFGAEMLDCGAEVRPTP